MYILTLFYYISQKYKKNTTYFSQTGGRINYNENDIQNMRLL